MSRHSLFRGALHCWPSAGLLVGGQLACRQVTPKKPGCGLPLRGHKGPRLVRASVPLSRVLTEAGVTPAVHLRGPGPLAASPTQPVSESGSFARLAVSSWAWEADTHARKFDDIIGDIGTLWCASSVHHNGAQRTRWRHRKEGDKQKGEEGDVHPSARSSLQHFTRVTQTPRQPRHQPCHDARMKDVFKDLNISTRGDMLCSRKGHQSRNKLALSAAPSARRFQFRFPSSCHGKR